MFRHPVITKDGSHTIAIPEMNVTYHSIHGAIRESQYVFIEAGLGAVAREEPIAILEMGFGTGLNALLTLVEAEKSQLQIDYTTVELFPLSPGEASTLNYCNELNRSDLQPLFNQLHQCEWEKDISLTPFFIFHKTNQSLIDFSGKKKFNLIYFDAFAPAAQPELWTKEIFEKLYAIMMPEGILVTYCSKGDVRRAMKAAGFNIEKIPGPPGKREMVRARR